MLLGVFKPAKRAVPRKLRSSRKAVLPKVTARFVTAPVSIGREGGDRST